MDEACITYTKQVVHSIVAQLQEAGVQSQINVTGPSQEAPGFILYRVQCGNINNEMFKEIVKYYDKIHTINMDSNCLTFHFKKDVIQKLLEPNKKYTNTFTGLLKLFFIYLAVILLAITIYWIMFNWDLDLKHILMDMVLALGKTTNYTAATPKQKN